MIVRDLESRMLFRGSVTPKRRCGAGHRPGEPGPGFQIPDHRAIAKSRKPESMCLAIPMRIARIDGPVAEVEVEGVKRRARLDLLPHARVGDYVLIHAGLAIALVDEDEARETLALLKELANDV